MTDTETDFKTMTDTVTDFKTMTDFKTDFKTMTDTVRLLHSFCIIPLAHVRYRSPIPSPRSTMSPRP
jgi:hypothetical protein